MLRNAGRGVNSVLLQIQNKLEKVVHRFKKLVLLVFCSAALLIILATAQMIDDTQHKFNYCHADTDSLSRWLV